MQIPFRLPFETSPDLRLVHSPWTGRSQVFADDVEIPGERRGRVRSFWVPLTDGTRVQLQLKNSGIDVLPRAAVVHGEPPTATPVSLAPPLTWWQYLLCGLPLMLVPVGGILGGIIGAMAAYMNLRAMRADIAAPLKALAALTVLVGASALYLAVVVLISAIANGGHL